ncbi:IS66 family insertion sequence element accessory protein TnpB [Lachnospiraceae bacterium NLAE-zl-G231]|uniref:IS66 family insertion sequence element accessory protein TnpB n=1 Tax=Lachnospiraceae TaxID=186803 RepID=UPI0011608B67
MLSYLQTNTNNEKSFLFLFCGFRTDRFKVLICEGDGFCLLISGLKPDVSDSQETRKKLQGSRRKNFIFC